eukprot:7376287-Prymnesium_polylepis.1
MEEPPLSAPAIVCADTVGPATSLSVAPGGSGAAAAAAVACVEMRGTPMTVMEAAASSVLAAAAVPSLARRDADTADAANAEGAMTSPMMRTDADNTATETDEWSAPAAPASATVIAS